jgi:hypothetical protein
LGEPRDCRLHFDTRTANRPSHACKRADYRNTPHSVRHQGVSEHFVRLIERAAIRAARSNVVVAGDYAEHLAQSP